MLCSVSRPIFACARNEYASVYGMVCSYSSICIITFLDQFPAHLTAFSILVSSDRPLFIFLFFIKWFSASRKKQARRKFGGAHNVSCART
jgi:hypothetical protein